MGGGGGGCTLDYNVSTGPFLSYEIEIGDGPGPELDNLFTKSSNGFMVSFMLRLSSGVVVDRLRLDSGFSVIFKWTVSEI